MGEAAEQLQAEIQNLRALISELRPPALDDLGLEAAIGALAERTRQQGLDVRLSIDLRPGSKQASERLGREIETTVYRIAQEALTNARKHGAATRVNVDLWEDDSNVHLTVQDDGHGFDMNSKGQGFGLVGITERVELLQGELEINSTPGKGTTLSVTVPSRRAAPSDALPV
jgi:signal transduction histidine kinase